MTYITSYGFYWELTSNGYLWMMLLQVKVNWFLVAYPRQLWIIINYILFIVYPYYLNYQEHI